MPTLSTASGGGSIIGLKSLMRCALAKLAAYQRPKKIRIDPTRRAAAALRSALRSAEPPRLPPRAGPTLASAVENATSPLLVFGLQMNESRIDLGQELRRHQVFGLDAFLDPLVFQRPRAHLTHTEAYCVRQRQTVDVVFGHGLNRL